MAPLDTGNTAWILLCAALVLLMTPGLALFYGGMVRHNSVVNMLMMSFSAMGTVGVVYVLWGYSMSFSGNMFGGLIGNPAAEFGLSGLLDRALAASSGAVDGPSGVPAMAVVAFQLTFAVIAVALISGSVADRMKFSAWLAVTVLWVTLAYFPLAHMVWGGGLLSSTGPVAAVLAAPLDFAGGTVVHINAGAAGLVLALMLGRRRDWTHPSVRPHNVPFVMLGAGLLWFGWFGFNAGSAGSAGGLAAGAWVNTCVAASAAMLGWLLVERLRGGHATGVGAASGAVAGLVAVTPAAGYVAPLGALAIGAVAGGVCALAVSWKYRFGLDDALDVVAVHLLGGLVGTVLVGVFATSSGLLYGGGYRQLVAQVIAAGVAVLWSALATAGTGLLVRATIGLRVHTDHEKVGLDLAVHGGHAYGQHEEHPLHPHLGTRLDLPAGEVLESRAGQVLEPAGG
jgi:Amt family ammonium transporter